MRKHHAAILFCLGSVGCASYEARPLDPEAHREAWDTRLKGHDTEADFAAGLAQGFSRPAGTYDPSDGFSLAEAEAAALVFHPRLRLARLRLQRARVDAERAGALPDPKLSAEVLRIAGSVPDHWVITPGLTFTVPLSDRRDAERAEATASLRATVQATIEQERSVILKLRKVWLSYSQVQEHIEKAEALLAELEVLSQRTARLVELGELRPGEAALVSLEQARMKSDLLRDRGLLEAKALGLKAAIGLAPGAQVTFHPALPHLAPIETGVATLLTQSPTLLRLTEEYAAAEQALRAAIAAQVPDLTLGPLFERDAGQDRIGLGGGLSVPLWNRNQRQIALAEADRELARAAYEAAVEELTAQLALAASQVKAASLQRQALEEELLPLTRGALSLAREELALGEGSLTVLLEALARVQKTETSLIQARAAEALARAEVLHLTGLPESKQ